MMWRLNLVINGLFDLLMRPFMVQSAWPGLIAASLVASIVLVVLFHFSSNQMRFAGRVTDCLHEPWNC